MSIISIMLYVSLVSCIQATFKFSSAEPSIGNKSTDSKLDVLRCRPIKKDRHTDGKRMETEICFAPECIHSASSILKNMDEEVDPCDDFYKFACGNFVRNEIIPDDEEDVSAFDVIEEKLSQRMKIMIEKETSPSELRAFRLIKNFYKICMNETSINEHGLKPLQEILKKFGGWPVLDGDDWDGRNFTWMESTFKSRQMGYSFDSFISFYIGTGLENTTERVIKLDQASLGLSKEHLMNGQDDDKVMEYLKLMIDVAVMLGANKERAEKEMRESLLFKMKIANISLSREERMNDTALPKQVTVRKLMDQNTSIPWLEYINGILGPTTNITENEPVIIRVPSYIADLEKILNETTKRTQANYAMWRIVEESTRYLNDQIRQRIFDYDSTVDGHMKKKPRWRVCMSMVSEYFPIGIGSMYIREYFNKDAKMDAEEMLIDIRRGFEEILQESVVFCKFLFGPLIITYGFHESEQNHLNEWKIYPRKVNWMDEETRNAAKDKAKSMTQRIAYPDELLDDKVIEELYWKVHISLNRSFLENVLDHGALIIENELAELRKPVTKTDWKNDAETTVVNAFYDPPRNSITFPASILQGVFFAHNRPDYLNYGAIGYIMGHEITHGFDDEGSGYDKHGNFKEWHTNATKQEFLEKIKCITHQANNYTISGTSLKIRGEDTQTENVADYGGLKAAYLAYNKRENLKGIEPKLPGLQDYTSKQMFWISAANTWCSKHLPENLQEQIDTDSHSPSEFRINGPMSNLPEFARDFRCSTISKMNPKNRCDLWEAHQNDGASVLINEEPSKFVSRKRRAFY